MIFILCAVLLAVFLLVAVLAAIKSREKSALCKKYIFGYADFAIITALVLMCSAMLFSGLGSRSSPESTTDVAKMPVAFAFYEPTYVEDLMIYPVSNKINGVDKLMLSYTDEAGREHHKVVTDYNVYSWYMLDVSQKISRLVIYAEGNRLEIGELGFWTEQGRMTADASLGAVFLRTDNGFERSGFEIGIFDEQETIPDRADYTNGMYFDEIFHSRTAKEYIDGESAYEWTHPPLGKILISEGIRLFGMNPFGWRFMSALFGVLTVAAMYLFAKLVTKNTLISASAGLLLTFDFMHQVQSRIGTVDVFLVFFVLLMYMFLYIALSREKVGYLSLLFSGISFGLAFSVKWSAIYAAIGAGIFLAMRILKKGEQMRERIKLFGFCALVFVLIPICIYVLSYIPFVSSDGKTGFAAILENQMNILSHHGESAVGMVHEYSSKWYTWAFNIKPVFYCSAWTDAQTVGAISTFGNPIVWWLGIVAVLSNAVLAIAKKDKKAVFLLAGYFSLMLPWMLIARPAFIYHYYPCTVFMILLTANMFLHITERSKKLSYVAIGLVTVASVCVLVMFLPVIRGIPVNSEYIDRFLQWIPTWNLYV